MQPKSHTWVPTVLEARTGGMASLRASSRLLREGGEDAASVDRPRGDVVISEAVGVAKTVSRESSERLHALVESARSSHVTVSLSMSDALRQRSREMMDGKYSQNREFLLPGADLVEGYGLRKKQRADEGSSGSKAMQQSTRYKEA